MCGLMPNGVSPGFNKRPRARRTAPPRPHRTASRRTEPRRIEPRRTEPRRTEPRRAAPPATAAASPGARRSEPWPRTSASQASTSLFAFASHECKNGASCAADAMAILGDCFLDFI